MEWINGDGPGVCELMVVGEAPGKDEEFQGRPFVGPSGRLLNEMLKVAGSSREEIYVTNVVKVRPPDNKLARLHEVGYKIDDFLPTLWKEINTINPNCILAVGKTALKYLTGHDKISNYRGSILSSIIGYPKIVPTIHPAALFERSVREGGIGSSPWKQKVFIQFDIKRAVEQSKFKEFRLPIRDLHVCKNSLDLHRFLARHENYRYMAVDVETYKAIPLCIGLAFTKSEAISCPLFNILTPTNLTGIARHEVIEMWRILANLLWDERIKKVGQNYKFDQLILENNGMPTRGFHADTMSMFSTLYPELPKKLQFISSIFTEEPYYKDEGKEFNPKKDSYDRLFLYNAKDAAVELECFEEMDIELSEVS